MFDNGVVSIDISGEECELSNSSSSWYFNNKKE
jgi:hypothetical protein